jgi:fructoselysine-6-P-deglycase FrlB-like protein
MANYTLVIEKDGKYTITSGSFTDNGTWTLGEDKDDIFFLSSQSGSTEEADRILRLKSKELWLKHTYPNGDIDEIHYKQK